MAISEKDKRIVWVRAAGRCSICRIELLLETSEAALTASVGDIAHIVAKEADGPRGKSTLTTEQRDQPDNLMLLCANHHRLVDQNVADYPVDRLKKIKADHEDWVANTLSKAPRIELKLATLNYINVPRLSILAALEGHRVSELPRLLTAKSLHSLESELVRVMVGFSALFNTLAIQAIPISKGLPVDSKLVGLLCSFNARFWTKNMAGLEPPKPDVPFTGDLKKDPHIYTKVGDFKWVLRINTKWITTSTAFVEFASGQGRFAGLCSVTNVDVRSKLINASPLVIGHPRSPMTDFMNSLAVRPGHQG